MVAAWFNPCEGGSSAYVVLNADLDEKYIQNWYLYVADNFEVSAELQVNFSFYVVVVSYAKGW